MTPSRDLQTTRFTPTAGHAAPFHSALQRSRYACAVPFALCQGLRAHRLLAGLNVTVVCKVKTPTCCTPDADFAGLDLFMSTVTCWWILSECERWRCGASPVEMTRGPTRSECGRHHRSAKRMVRSEEGHRADLRCSPSTGLRPASGKTRSRSSVCNSAHPGKPSHPGYRYAGVWGSALSTRQNSDPFPGSLLTSIRPACRLVTACTKASPSPVP